MSNETPRFRPTARPTHPMAKRLEDIRQAEGFSDLKSFHAAVASAADRAESFPSYASARLYHFKREAPVGYLAAVARRFGYRLEWLATGEEPARVGRGMREYTDQVDESIATNFPEFEMLLTAERGELRDLLMAFEIAPAWDQMLDVEPIGGIEWLPEPDDGYEGLVRTALMAPLRMWREDNFETRDGMTRLSVLLSSEDGRSYVRAVILALRLAIPLALKARPEVEFWEHARNTQILDALTKGHGEGSVDTTNDTTTLPEPAK